MEEYTNTGRRKTSVASVRLRPGTGKIDINDKKWDSYFSTIFMREAALQPLKVTDNVGKFDLIIRVKGGGIRGQVEAVRLGIARALVELNEDYKHELKEHGYLTRDPRKKERKKYGLAKARKRFQFSKR